VKFDKNKKASKNQWFSRNNWQITNSLATEGNFDWPVLRFLENCSGYIRIGSQIVKNRCLNVSEPGHIGNFQRTGILRSSRTASYQFPRNFWNCPTLVLKEDGDWGRQGDGMLKMVMAEMVKMKMVVVVMNMGMVKMVKVKRVVMMKIMVNVKRVVKMVMVEMVGMLEKLWNFRVADTVKGKERRRGSTDLHARSALGIQLANLVPNGFGKQPS
jgi:hypothetical protein